MLFRTVGEIELVSLRKSKTTEKKHYKPKKATPMQITPKNIAISFDGSEDCVSGNGRFLMYKYKG